jgi:hypothetical protein
MRSPRSEKMNADEGETRERPNINRVLSTQEQGRWVLFGKHIPKAEIVFFAQVIVLYIVIITSIVNLTLANGVSTLWTALLSSSLGYLLPNPTLEKEKLRRQRASRNTLEGDDGNARQFLCDAAVEREHDRLS